MRLLIPTLTSLRRAVLGICSTHGPGGRGQVRDQGMFVRCRALWRLAALGVIAFPTVSRAQFSIQASYGFDRNVASSEAELDGLLSITLDWISSSGLGFGIGTDHQFEGAMLSPNQHLGWSLYLTPSFELPRAAVAPFIRGGIGLGRAPCLGDTCTDGAYFRGSTGIRFRVVERLRFVGEIGMSRVSRPFGGVGLLLRL